MASEETTEAFGGRIFQAWLDSMSIFGVSSGVELGLFDVLAKFEDAQTSEVIAKEAGYRERYVREWLNLVSVSKIVEVDPSGLKYFLPHHRRPILCGNGKETLASSVTRITPMVGLAHADVLKAFKPDGPRGTTYASYPVFHDIMNRNRTNGFSPKMFDDTFKMFPELEAQLKSGIQMCEVGPGLGLVSQYFAKRFPNSTITATDFNPDVIKDITEKSAEKGLTNLRAIVHDAGNLPADWSDKFDYIFICDTIHDVPNSSQVVKNLYRILKPGGYMSVMELNANTNPHDNVGNELAKFVYSVSLFHCLPISHNTEGSEALGAGWGKQHCRQMLEDIGFKDYKLIDVYEIEYHAIVRK
jgi:ubiquinone/menaquinone biosynthesis C-methylase UbiE